MLKSKIFIIGLLILTIIFCLHLNGRSIAGDCDEIEHSKGTPIITGNHSYPAGWLCTADPDIEYDTENSSETVDQNDSATILVIGNNAPFTWTISGTGFWFDSGYTQTTINTTGNAAVIYADNTACGSGTITVTGCDEATVTGYVRCTTGQWIHTGGGAHQSCGSLGRYEYCGAYTFWHSGVHRTRWDPAFRLVGDWAYGGPYDFGSYTDQHGRVYPARCTLAVQVGCGYCEQPTIYFCGDWTTEYWGCQ